MPSELVSGQHCGWYAAPGANKRARARVHAYIITRTSAHTQKMTTESGFISNQERQMALHALRGRSERRGRQARRIKGL